MGKRIGDALLLPAAVFAALAAASLPIAVVTKAWWIMASRPEPDTANGVMALVLGSLAVAVAALTQIQRMVADHVRSAVGRTAVGAGHVTWGLPYVLRRRVGGTSVIGTNVTVSSRLSAASQPASNRTGADTGPAD